MLIYTKTVMENGVLAVLVVELSRHILEKITQNKANYLIGNVKNVLQNQKDFLKTDILATSKGFITNSGNQQIGGVLSGILIIKLLLVAIQEGVPLVDGN